MADIKPLASVAAKWKSNASATEARNAYNDGVNSPRRSWATSAAAADQARKDGLASADARNAFVNGVTAAGDAKWKSRSVGNGVPRFSQGVANAQQDYQNGFAPYHAVIAGLTLPPRGPKGSPENLNRVAAIASALHTARTT